MLFDYLLRASEWLALLTVSRHRPTFGARTLRIGTPNATAKPDRRTPSRALPDGREIHPATAAPNPRIGRFRRSQDHDPTESSRPEPSNRTELGGFRVANAHSRRPFLQPIRSCGLQRCRSQLLNHTRDRQPPPPKPTFFPDPGFPPPVPDYQANLTHACSHHHHHAEPHVSRIDPGRHRSATAAVPDPVGRATHRPAALARSLCPERAKRHGPEPGAPMPAPPRRIDAASVFRCRRDSGTMRA